MTASSAAETSPSVMKRIRLPASRIWRTPSAWRSRSRITVVISVGLTPRRSATRLTTSPIGSSRLRQSAISGPPTSFSM